jgi:hypothetical protein
VLARIGPLVLATPVLGAVTTPAAQARRLPCGVKGEHSLARGRRKRWRDLSGRQRAGIVVTGGVQLTLLAAALTDLRRRPAAEVRGDKRLWVAASFVNFAGPLAYFAFGRRRRG